MILPPHILKYQRQLQELNKKSSLVKKTEPTEKNNQKEKDEKEIKGKNKPNNKFLQSKNSSLNLPPHLKNKEFSISQNTDKTNQDRITNNKKDLLSLKESEEEEDSEKSSETISENQNQIEAENKKLSKREEKMKENWRIYRK